MGKSYCRHIFLIMTKYGSVTPFSLLELLLLLTYFKGNFVTVNLQLTRITGRIHTQLIEPVKADKHKDVLITHIN